MFFKHQGEVALITRSDNLVGIQLLAKNFKEGGFWETYPKLKNEATFSSNSISLVIEGWLKVTLSSSRFCSKCISLKNNQNYREYCHNFKTLGKINRKFTSFFLLSPLLYQKFTTKSTENTKQKHRMHRKFTLKKDIRAKYF